MSARSFRSVFMVASCAGAALGCYLVSLRVASERAALEQVETEIVLAQRDIRLLHTESSRAAGWPSWTLNFRCCAVGPSPIIPRRRLRACQKHPQGRQVALDAPVVLRRRPPPGANRNLHRSPAMSRRVRPVTRDLSCGNIKRQIAPAAGRR